MNSKLSPLITIDELFKLKSSALDLVIVDVQNGKNALENYNHKHLDGAVFIDLNTDLATIEEDLSKGGRHPLPSIDKFSKLLGSIGISAETHVVIYDDKNGANAAARFWWMLKSVGHKNVQVLNGGLQIAEKSKFPLSSISFKNPIPTTYPIDGWKLRTIMMSEVEKASSTNDYLIIDVREAKRYKGEIEPIDLIAGHIPGAINIPFTENLDEDGFFLDQNVLKNKYESAFGMIKAENIIVHCGSGVTACHTLLAIAYTGLEIPNLYVGSWSEWSRNGKAVRTI